MIRPYTVVIVHKIWMEISNTGFGLNMVKSRRDYSQWSVTEYESRRCKPMKMTKIMVAMIMVTCVFAAVVYADASDAEPAPTTAPEIKFWVYENNAWAAYSGHGYYAGQAIANSGLTFTWGTESYYGTTLNGADFTYQYDSYGTTYTNINPYYGKIATVNNSSDFTIYRYMNGNWNPISSDSYLTVMGFYKPFDDYQLASANIAFVPNGVSPNTLPTTGLAHVYNVIPDQGTPDTAYAVDFHINGNTYTGYGSDCAIALKNALDSNNIANTIDLRIVYPETVVIDNVTVNRAVLNNSYYGEAQQIGTQTKTTTYTAEYDSGLDKTFVSAYYEYWSVYLDNDEQSVFMLGFMSPLSGQPTIPPVIIDDVPYYLPSLTQDEFSFEYEDFTYDWVENGDTTGNYP